MCMFKVGDKVERINHSKADAKLGKCYTVTGVSAHGDKLALRETNATSCVWNSVNFKLVEDQRRPHYDLILAWANGTEIQCKCGNGKWRDCPHPHFHHDVKYRIKPDNSEKIEKLEDKLASLVVEVSDLRQKIKALKEA